MLIRDKNEGVKIFDLNDPNLVNLLDSDPAGQVDTLDHNVNMSPFLTATMNSFIAEYLSENTQNSTVNSTVVEVARYQSSLGQFKQFFIGQEKQSDAEQINTLAEGLSYVQSTVGPPMIRDLISMALIVGAHKLISYDFFSVENSTENFLKDQISQNSQEYHYAMDEIRNDNEHPVSSDVVSLLDLVN